jgi:hypothetical protein
MKMRNRVFAVAGCLLLAGAAHAQGGMGMGMKGGMGMMGDADAKVTKEDYLKRAEARFARMDSNKDGVIDATDRAAMRERMRECRELMGDMHMMGGRMGMRGSRAPAAAGTSGQDHEAHHPTP